jgi:hypothetical protein
LLPIFVALPLSEKENRNLTPVDVVKREVGRVQTNWGNRVCLWDPRFLIFDDNDAEADTHHLGNLLSQFVLFGARVIPVVGLRESYHRAAIVSAHAHRTGSGVAIRIEYDDIQDYDLLEAQLATLRLAPPDCVLVVDISTADISEHDEFAKSLVGWLFSLRAKGEWARIVVTSSSFPGKNPAPSEGQIAVPRHEWRLWDWALGLEPSLKDFVIFGDFGADNGIFKFGGGGKPIPHLRYLITLEWLIVRGDKTYQSLRSVAKRIVGSSSFKGRDFSAGDEFIADCAAETIGTADPTQWRSVNMNHHMTAAVRQLAQLYGVELLPRKASAPEQVGMFDAVEAGPQS